MTLELTMLTLTLVLALAQIIVAAVAKRLQEPPGWALGARDEPVNAYTGIAARLVRAQSNILETLPLFAAAVLACHAAGRDGALSAWGSELYFWARLVYVGVYAAGLVYVRTAVWMAAIAGLCMVLLALLLGA